MADIGSARAGSAAGGRSWPSIGPSRSRFFAHVRASRERLLNHPGHSSQKSHGRQGGIRDALAGAGSVAELNAAAAAEAKRITGHDVEFDMGTSDLEIAKGHVEGVLRGFERYPDADLHTVRTELGGEEWARTSPRTGTITFNSRYADDAGYYHHSIAENGPGWTAVPSPIGTGAHEFGHIVVSRGGSDGAAYAAAGRSARQAGVPLREHVTKNVSEYATESFHELSAEAFADVLVNGSGANPLSQEIMKVIDTAYAGAGGMVNP